jgi:hypothetical protein
MAIGFCLYVTKLCDAGLKFQGPSSNLIPSTSSMLHPYTRLFTQAAPAASRFARKDLRVIPKVWNTSGSPCLRRLYSTSSQGASSNGGKGYTQEIILASTVGLAVALGVYSTRRVRLEPLRTESSSDRFESSALETNYASPEELRLSIQELQQTFPDKHAVETDPETLQSYGSSENSYHPTSPHSVVVHVHSTEDVVKVVNISRKYRVPLTAYSGATSLEGHFAGVCGLSALQISWMPALKIFVSIHQEVSVWICLAWTK